ncbi:MAG: Fic family protein [Candidatus Metalachnospira sp.]|nr:Fic family protein [Candidatus Metalachnospira sp.]
MDEILKSAAIHFYVAYLHPYFDGNGRRARFLHLWYLVQKDYSSAMFVSFSYLISRSKVKYYNAYRAVENNVLISGVIDITPFLKYFNENIYNKLETESINSIDLMYLMNL